MKNKLNLIKWEKGLIILGIFIILLNINITSIGAEKQISTLQEYQKALVETAKAFWRKGTNVQYDSYHKRFTRTPEDATKDDLNYTVCSGFVYSVYNQALGLELPTSTNDLTLYAKAIQNTDYVTYYKEYENPGIDKDYKEIYNKIQNGKFTFQVGDLLVIRWAKSVSGDDNEDYKGHVMMVLSVDGEKVMLIHANGHNKNGYTISSDPRDRLDEETSNQRLEGTGAIKISELKKYLKENFAPTVGIHPVTTFSIIRPLATKDGKYWKENIINIEKDKTGNVINYNYEYKHISDDRLYKVSSAAKLRMKYPEMDVYKTGSMHSNSVVDLGDKITYTIKIKNNSSKDYTDMQVKEMISPYVNLIEYNGATYSNVDRILSWNNITVEAGKTKVIKYTVKVKANIDNIGKNIISKGKIENEKVSLLTATVKNQIANTLTNNQQQKLIQTYNDLSKTSKKTGLAFINEIYEKSSVATNKLSSYLVTSTGTGKNLNDILGAGSRHFVAEEKEKYNAISPNNLRGRYDILKKYGKRSYQTVNEYETDLVNRGNEKHLLPENLKVGDIIVFAKSATKNPTLNVSTTIAYLYLGDKLVARTSSGVKSYVPTPRINGITADEYAIQESVGDINYALRMNQALANTSAYYGWFVLSPAMVPSLIKDDKILEPEVTGNTSMLTTEKTLTIETVDDESGLADEPYSFDGGKTWTSQKSKKFTENQTVNIWVKDKAGNIAKKQVVISKIDAKKTVVTITGNTNTLTTEKTLTIETVVDESGLADKPYSFDGGKTWTSQKSKKFTENQTVNIWVKDKVGNITKQQEIITKIDNNDSSETISRNIYNWTKEKIRPIHIVCIFGIILFIIIYIVGKKKKLF